MAHPKAIAVVDKSRAAHQRARRLLARLHAYPPRSSPPTSLSWDAHERPDGLSTDVLSYWLVFLHCGFGAQEFRSTFFAAYDALERCRADELPAFVCYSGGPVDPLLSKPPRTLDPGRHWLVCTRIIPLTGPETGPLRPPSEWRLASFIEAAAARYPHVDKDLWLTLYYGESNPPTPHLSGAAADARSLAHGLRNLLREVQRILQPRSRGSREAEDDGDDIQPCLRYLERLTADARRLPVTETAAGVPIASALETLLWNLGQVSQGEPNLTEVHARVDALLLWCDNGHGRFSGYE
jgi:hypothetical protein